MQGSTALHHACAGSSVTCVAVLLDAGAETDAQDFLGRTALHIACRRVLLHSTAPKSGCTLKLTCVCSEGSESDTDGASACALLLLDRGCDFNLRDNFKCTALHRAAGT